MWKKAEKYYQTLKYLKKSQLIYLVKNRLDGKKSAVPEMTAPAVRHLSLWIRELDEREDYLERFCVEEILDGQVTLLHESGIPGGADWINPDKSHLWNFNLQYLEFLIPLASSYRKSKALRYYECFRDYCRRWMEDNRTGRGDGWHPYTISLRLTNLWICMDGFGEIIREDRDFFRELNDSMYAQYVHLQKRLELHLLGNHYFENIKAVLLGAWYFQEPKVWERFRKKYLSEVREQILPDGIHYERSLMYHKIILEDLMRTAKGLSKCDPGFCRMLLPTMQLMADAAYSLENGIGRTLLFNDAGDNVARPLGDLLEALKEEFQILPVEKREFPEAGYYCLEDDGIKLVLDAGEIAPDHMPGHGHCDGLSFELAYDGAPVFANSGTGQYQGSMRPYYRSTAAHNTVVIDGQEQSECWGEHRVAHRIHQVSGSCKDHMVSGRLTTCRGKEQERSLSLRDHMLTVQDCVKGEARAYLHLVPGYEYVTDEENDHENKQPAGDLRGRGGNGQKVTGIRVRGPKGDICEILPGPDDQVTVHRSGTICSYAPEFGKTEQMQVLELLWTGDGTEHEIRIKFL